MTKQEKAKYVKVLYERCALGEISINQREALIRKMNDSFVVKESSCNSLKIPRGYTPSQVYSLYKESVYKKFTDGLITESTREELLLDARNKLASLASK